MFDHISSSPKVAAAIVQPFCYLFAAFCCPRSAATIMWQTVSETSILMCSHCFVSQLIQFLQSKGCFLLWSTYRQSGECTLYSQVHIQVHLFCVLHIKSTCLYKLILYNVLNIWRAQCKNDLSDGFQWHFKILGNFGFFSQLHCILG